MEHENDIDTINVMDDYTIILDNYLYNITYTNPIVYDQIVYINNYIINNTYYDVTNRQYNLILDFLDQFR